MAMEDVFKDHLLSVTPINTCKELNVFLFVRQDIMEIRIQGNVKDVLLIVNFVSMEIHAFIANLERFLLMEFAKMKDVQANFNMENNV